ncbi:hypothetical protein WICPIJ_003021 [Wickerhamomyces pijperi]|uniref:Uncharacterized protein n=1 Tax=Wickerhamomyces pijperi TaxID=599730 RepID=A0A9P8Q8Q2_WICPI|nr:hypothetical protein WICPIJ_003021 [Wickerhamomyces pijperi]
MSFLNPEAPEEQHQQLLRTMDNNEDEELRRLNERVFGMIEQVLDDAEMAELNRQRERQGQRQPQSFFSSVANGFVNTLFVILLPLVFTRIILQLLAISTNTEDFSYGVAEYYATDSFDEGLYDGSILMKFHFIFASELSSVLSMEYIKIITLCFYVAYSLTMSSYMLFTFVFYLFCILLTTSRRWNDIVKFLTNVIRSKTGVF